MSGNATTVGKAELRKDAWDKVTGAARYAADIPLDNLFYGVLLRSPHHFARIKQLDCQAARQAPGVAAVLTIDDVPGDKCFAPLSRTSRPSHTALPAILVSQLLSRSALPKLRPATHVHWCKSRMRNKSPFSTLN
jgi:CO/xanthine dehydrogenase Mo-binding subunit